MMELHHLPRNSTSSGRGAETKLFKLQQIDVKNTKKCSKRDLCAKPIVRTQFAMTPDWYWVCTFKAQTIKFVERGCSRTRLTF